MSTIPRPHCEPAASIITDLGGVDVVVAFINERHSTEPPRSASMVYRWVYEAPRGCGGYIPRWHHDDLIELAKTQGWVLPRERFSHPADVPLPARLKKEFASIIAEAVFRQAS